MNASMWILAIAIAHAPLEWETFLHTNELHIDYRYTHSNTLEISAKRSVRSCPAAFLHLLADTDRIHEWVSNASKTTILAQPTSNSHIVHTEFTAIWPVAPRDMVTSSRWYYEAETRTLKLQINDASEVLAPLEGSVRMTEVSATWTLQENSHGITTVHYQGLANPAGHIPRSLARRAALRAIRQSFLALDDILQDYQYGYLQVPCDVNTHLTTSTR